MIDLKFLRENPDAVRTSQRIRGENPALVDDLLAADESRRATIQVADALRNEQKTFGKKIGAASKEERPALLRLLGFLPINSERSGSGPLQGGEPSLIPLCQ